MQSKTLPTKKINNKTMPQTWYHKRMTQFDRFTELKSLYERFKIIHQRQKAFIDDKSVGWEDFPASLIENLRTYEMLPSDELIGLASWTDYLHIVDEKLAAAVAALASKK